MEKWTRILKDGATFIVSTKGDTIIKLVDQKIIGIVPQHESGGHKGNRYLKVTHLNNHYYVHRLIYEAFVGPIPVGMTINHIDGNKENNDISNLELLTRGENMSHSWSSGQRDHLKVPPKVKEGRMTLSEMRSMNKYWGVYDSDLKFIKSFKTQDEAAQYIGVSRQTVSRSFQLGRIIISQYYVCEIDRIEELKERIELRRNTKRRYKKVRP